MTSSLNTNSETIIKKGIKSGSNCQQGNEHGLTWLKGRTRTATVTRSVLGTGIFPIFSLSIMLFGRKITKHTATLHTKTSKA
ncbi:hypothetical protein I79_026011 [Cricetulus griseus]|uniref:Uncharacterized protein n=1 Tax=Cricetulus griseus TaxID=10029 RepID=G3IPT3_CRIGR|nr:hypothetical protein I79_026011 [Cricetulus griseus]